MCGACSQPYEQALNHSDLKRSNVAATAEAKLGLVDFGREVIGATVEQIQRYVHEVLGICVAMGAARGSTRECTIIVHAIF